MVLLALLSPSSFLLVANSPALRHTPRAVVTAHHDHSRPDKFDTSPVWSEPSWDRGYTLGKYSRTSQVEAYGLHAATERENRVFQAASSAGAPAPAGAAAPASAAESSTVRILQAVQQVYPVEAAAPAGLTAKALTNSISEYSRESLAARDAWLDWLPRPTSNPLLEKLAIALGLKARDEWLEGCLLEAGDDEAKRGACMA